MPHIHSRAPTPFPRRGGDVWRPLSADIRVREPLPNSLPRYSCHRDYQAWQDSEQFPVQQLRPTDQWEQNYVRIQDSIHAPRYSVKHISITRIWSREDRCSTRKNNESDEGTSYRPPSYEAHRREVQQRIKKHNAIIARRPSLEGLKKKVRFKGVEEELSRYFSHLNFDSQ